MDRIDQSTVGIARMQRELTQSTVRALNDQLHDSLGMDEEDDMDEAGDDLNDDSNDHSNQDVNEVDGDDDEDDDEDNDEDNDKTEETQNSMNLDVKEIQAAIEELEEVVPKRRGRPRKQNV